MVLKNALPVDNGCVKMEVRKKSLTHHAPGLYLLPGSKGRELGKGWYWNERVPLCRHCHCETTY